jgi:hypothetical protein
VIAFMPEGLTTMGAYMDSALVGGKLDAIGTESVSAEASLPPLLRRWGHPQVLHRMVGTECRRRFYLMRWFYLQSLHVDSTACEKGASSACGVAQTSMPIA